MHEKSTLGTSGKAPGATRRPDAANDAALPSEYKADTQQFAGRDVADLDLAVFDCIVLIGETARNLTPDQPPSFETHFWDVPDPYNAVGTSDEVVEVYRQCAVELLQRLENLLAPAGNLSPV